MSILDAKPIESALPTLGRPMLSLDGNEDQIVGALRQRLAELEQCASQRAGLEDMLKDMKRKDNILPKLMTTSGSYEDLFKKELGKYDLVSQEVARNIENQERLFRQIKMHNDAFAATFNLEDFKIQKEKAFNQVRAAVAKYREIRENINEGLKFYVTLQVHSSLVLFMGVVSTVTSFCLFIYNYLLTVIHHAKNKILCSLYNS